MEPHVNRFPQGTYYVRLNEAFSAHTKTMKPASSDTVREELDVLIRGRYPLLYIVSAEEERVDEMLHGIANDRRKLVYYWSISGGLRRVANAGENPPRDESSRDPFSALDAMDQVTKPSLFIIKDFHPFLNDPTIVRRLRELAMRVRSTYKTLIIVSPVLEVPRELEKMMTVIDFPLPSLQEIYDLLHQMAKLVKKREGVQVTLTKPQAEEIAKAALGLTLAEAEGAFAKAIVDDNLLSGKDIEIVLQEKRQIIRKSEMLEYYSVDDELEHVGGLDLLKSWLVERGRAFSEKAREFGLPQPKGMLLIGVQGCGKSLTAKVISSLWHMPLLRFDVGRVFGSLVGSSESNMRRAIQTAESIAPCILWIDEIEKGVAGVASSGMSDGGTTSRVFNHLLTWLQEKTQPVFVVATANRIEALPPELMRKGRFDEIFFIDLPSADEREQILKIHLEKRNRDVTRFDLPKIAAAANWFSGAELEQVVISGLHKAFAASRELSEEDLLLSVQETVPLATTMREEIQGLRSWAAQRTRPASTSEKHSDRERGSKALRLEL